MTSSGHRRSVGLYIVLALVVAVALGLYQLHTNQKLRRIDRVSCENRLLILRWHVQRADGVHDMATGRLWRDEFREQLERTTRRCS